MLIKNRDSSNGTAWAQIPALPRTSCVIIGKLHNLPVLVISHVKHEYLMQVK